MDLLTRKCLYFLALKVLFHQKLQKISFFRAKTYSNALIIESLWRYVDSASHPNCYAIVDIDVPK